MTASEAAATRGDSTLTATSRGSCCNRTRRSILVSLIVMVAFLVVVVMISFHSSSSTDKDYQQQQQKKPTTSDNNNNNDDDSNNVVLVLGLPYSGSQALHRYFQCRGMTSRHYCCGNGGDGSAKGLQQEQRVDFPCPSLTCGDCILQNLQQHGNNQNPFDGCNGGGGGSGDENNHDDVQVWAAFDVERRDEWFLPQHFALGVLHQAYPTATWILNTRSSPRRWATTSIGRWHSRTRRILQSFGYALGVDDKDTIDATKTILNATTTTTNSNRKAVTHAQILEDMERRVVEQRRSPQHKQQRVLEDIYRNHTRMIRTWAHAINRQHHQQQHHQQHQQSINYQHQGSHHRLIEINVDDDPAVIMKLLDHHFGGFHRKDEDNVATTTKNQACGWTYRAPDEDWNDIRLPF